jgi:hypothetical protein
LLSTDIYDEIFTADRNDTLEPKHALFITLMQPAKIPLPLTENPLPSLAAERKEIQDPNASMFNALNFATLTPHLTEREEPKQTASKIEL